MLPAAELALNLATALAAGATGTAFAQGDPNIEMLQPKARAAAMKMDANKDGNITRDEFDLTWDKSLKEHFKRLDANADGSLVADEMPRGPGRGQGPGGGRRGGPGRGPQE